MRVDWRSKHATLPLIDAEQDARIPSSALRRASRAQGRALIPGPVDPDDFWDAERRHRRASWRFTALAAVATFVCEIVNAAV